MYLVSASHEKTRFSLHQHLLPLPFIWKEGQGAVGAEFVLDAQREKNVRNQGEAKGEITELKSSGC